MSAEYQKRPIGSCIWVRSPRILWLRSVAHYSAPAVRDRTVSLDDRHPQSWIPEVRFGCSFVLGLTAARD